MCLFNVYTTYWANWATLGGKFARLAVCSRVYQDNYDEWLKGLAPKRWKEYNAEEITLAEMMNSYQEQLNTMYHNGAMDKYIKIIEFHRQYRDVVLMCYEKSPQPCHRYLLASFLEKHYGYHIEEY